MTNNNKKLFLLIVGKMNTRIYVGYNIFYILGTLLAMQIPFVGFQAIHSSEHMASHGVFIFLQVILFYFFVIVMKLLFFDVFIRLIILLNGSKNSLEKLVSDF